MDWMQVLTVFIIVATNLATVVVLHIHLDSKTTNLLSAIHQEMKEFHGRLERQDAEFKAGMLRIEEKIRSR